MAIVNRTALKISKHQHSNMVAVENKLCVESDELLNQPIEASPRPSPIKISSSGNGQTELGHEVLICQTENESTKFNSASLSNISTLLSFVSYSEIRNKG